MKKTSLSIVLAAALVVPGFALASDAAADRGPRGHDPERRIVQRTAELELDAHQLARVREVMSAARAERDALRELPRSPERREQQRAIMARAHDRIDALLTPAQRAAVDARRAERAQRMEHRRARPGAQRGEVRGDRGAQSVDRAGERVGPEARRSERGLERSDRAARGPERAAGRGLRGGSDPRAT